MTQKAPLIITDAFIDAYVKPYYLEAHRQYFKFDYIDNILSYCDENQINLSTSQKLATLFSYSRWMPMSQKHFEDGATLLKLAVDISNMESNEDVLNAQQIVRQLADRNMLTIDSALIFDLDRMRFGQDPEEYSKYEQLLRLEFSFIDDQTWSRVRTGVLNAFLNEPQFFATQQFADKFEQTAKSNIENQIRFLQG